MKTAAILIILYLVAVSCNVLVDQDVPECIYKNKQDRTSLLPEAAKLRIEGVYKVIHGNDTFGDRVVIKSCNRYLSIFTEKNAAYIILEYIIPEGGNIGSELFFEGCWRYAKSMECGLVKLSIPSGYGGEELLSDTSAVDSIMFSGQYGKNCNNLGKDLTLSYERHFNPKRMDKDFYIIAHRGGGRTADYLPASENTLEIIELAERLGANGIEIDVRLSKDRIPFLYHDNTINSRLIQKSTVWGKIEDFTFAQLKTHITLVNGEKIPSLQEALEFVLEHTYIKFVWLDMKSAKNEMAEVIAIQKEILERAETMGRDLEIYVGLPTKEKVNDFLAYDGWQDVPSLCELSVEDVLRTESQVWGPRWTLGVQTNEINQMHDKGILVIPWTLDETKFIKQYMTDGDFDGMLSNYAPLVAYFYYVQK
jgi:glycerophosphoryl diester phosphodiesterase